MRKLLYKQQLYMIATIGDLLVMMGQNSRSEALFYYFRLEDQVPENQLLAADRQPCQLRLCAHGFAGVLQRNGTSKGRHKRVDAGIQCAMTPHGSCKVRGSVAC